MSFPKSLIIGLGGVGSDIVSRVYKRYMDSNPTDLEKGMVGFLCFDTDANDIEMRRKIMPKEFVIQTSATTNITVATYIDSIRNSNPRNTVEEWFDTSQKLLLQATLNDGAGQIRMASRLALSLAYDEGRFDIVDKVINKILEIQADKAAGNDIRVHIVSTMAGGTGAGSFLQISYLIKEKLKEHELDKPRITGYFLLADVLCQDPSTQFDDQKEENTLANTYASIKELNGIYNYEKTPEGINLDFEYRFFTDEEQTHTFPDYEPFEVSYLYDFEDANGENRGKKENYYDQIEDYLYLNVLSPVGAKTRSAAINDILGSIKKKGVNRYASTGVSKIVYPVDDLLRLFATKRVAENLQTSWLKIDKAYLALLAEYKRKVNLGIILERPELDKFFMDQVEYLSKNGTGLEKVIFRKIYQSTQIFNKDGSQIGHKSLVFLQELMAYLVKAKENKKSINDQNQELRFDAIFLQDNNPVTDVQVINENDKAIRTLQKEVLSFIENTKSLGIEEGLLADYQEHNYISQADSRINSFLLKKDEIMHPLAVRFFLYELRRQMKAKLASLKDENEKAWENIQGFEKAFDIKDDQEKDEHIETASEAYQIYLRKDKKLIKQIARIFGNAGSLQDFKEKYLTRTKKQANLLNQYAVTKLQEEVLAGLLSQVVILIDEIESLFNNLSDVHAALMRETKGLSQMHEDLSNNSTQFVLARPEIKEKIYQEKIALLDDIEFPQDLSQLIYHGLYRRVYHRVNKSRKDNTKTSNMTELFAKDVIDKQKEHLAVSLKEDLAGYNVIQAIRYEAKLMDKDDYLSLKRYFSEAIKLANPLGAKNVSRFPHINAWGIHPECLQVNMISQTDADDIMGSTGDSGSGAYRVISKFFSRTEVIRESSRFLLSVPENYPQFSSGNNKNIHSVAPLGKYYKAYKARIDDVLNGSSVSPHLDKRWHLPGYFPNIGETREVVAEKVYRAFFWGLINRDIVVRQESGDKQWVFLRASSNTSRVLLDQHQKAIKFNIPSLLFQGLYSNPGIVDSIIERANKIIKDNKDEFETGYSNDKLHAMFTMPLIQDIVNYRLTEIRQIKDLSILQILDKINIKDKEKIQSVILETIADLCILVGGGKNQNARKVARKVIFSLLGMKTNEKNATTIKAENIIKRRFESETEK